MANIEIRKVEEQLNRRLLFSVQVSGDTDRMEFPVGIPDQGSPAANDAAVLTSALAFAERSRQQRSSVWLLEHIDRRSLFERASRLVPLGGNAR